MLMQVNIAMDINHLRTWSQCLEKEDVDAMCRGVEVSVWIMSRSDWRKKMLMQYNALDRYASKWDGRSVGIN